MLVLSIPIIALTFTGLGTNYFSNIPHIFKVNSIKTLIYRSFHISSSYFSFDIDCKFLLIFFVSNGYPSHIFNKCLKLFLNSIFVEQPKYPTVNNDVRFIKLPFLGYATGKLRNELSKLLTDSFPQIHFNLIFFK